MNFTIQLSHVEPFWTLDFATRIGISILFFLTFGFGIVVQKQLIAFLKFKKKRPVNQIIYKNLILQNIFIPPQLCYLFAEIWNYYPGKYFGEYGCYGFFFAGIFIVNHDRAHSFFINLFRYICIVKKENLSENEILPKVSNTFVTKYIF